MRYVYVVISDYDRVSSIFDSEEKALKHIEEKCNSDSLSTLAIEKWEVK